MAADKQESVKDQRQADNFWGTISRLFRYMLSKRKTGLTIAFLLTIGSITFQSLAPSILGRATDIIYAGVQEAMDAAGTGIELDTIPIDFNALINIIVILAVIYLSQTVLRYFQILILAHVSQRTVYNLRRDLKAKMSTLPVKYYDTHANGDIMSRAVNDIDQISNTLRQSLIQILNAVVMFVVVLIVMLSVNVTLSIVILVTVPLSILFIAYVLPKSQKQFAVQQKELGKVTDRAEEIYSGHSIVKTYNHENSELEEFKVTSAKLNEASWKAHFLAGIMMPLVNFARDLAYFGVGIVGGIGVLNGSIQLGHVQAFMQYANQFSQPIRFIAQLSNTIQVTVASVERVFEVIDEEPMHEVESNVEPKENTPYKIQFEHVQFGYDDSDDAELLMNDFNLTVEPGEMVAIVGPTGAGKSTLINLLERFYDVKGGSIRFEGKDVRDFDRDELRQYFSMVLQDTWLFKGTIWDNIKYGTNDPNVSDQQILEAAKAAHVDDFVQRLPGGYRTMINEEGSNVSQGQRQLITIARAFLADPEVLILDEATSSVDTRTEKMVQQAMDKALEGRTSFVVAHRLSTIRDADKIIVMNHGDVIETGNHDELIEKDGFYAGLYNAQFAGQEG